MKKSYLLCWLMLTLILSISSIYGQFAGGDGTEADPYQVANAEQLNNVRNYLTSWFIQTADINLGVAPWNLGEGWNPIGCYNGDDSNPSTFRGSYDGNNFEIRNLYINRPSSTSIGLFGVTQNTLGFTNMFLTDVNITGYDCVGSLAGYFTRNPLISNCHATGIVSGNINVGGLFGVADNHPGTNTTMAISQCSFIGSVLGTYKVGGLNGVLTRTRLIDCFSRGSVNGGSAVGGLIGAYHMAFVSNCYSQNNAGGILGQDEGSSSVSGCYWNSNTATGPAALYGEGRTTVEMTYPYAANTFVGWDFTNAWQVDASYVYNDGYPILQNMMPEVPSFIEVATTLPQVDGSYATWGDYDNDGDLDILITGYIAVAGSTSKIYRNNGNGSFTDISAGLTGAYYSSAEWGDFDNDGDLDVLISGNNGNYNNPPLYTKIYQNNGNDSFSEINVGLQSVVMGTTTWGDYDNDGDLDILLTGYMDSIQNQTPIAKIYRNNGNSTFTDVNISLTNVGNSSAAWGDYDNDGDLDILLMGKTSTNTRISLVYRNNGDDTFTDINAGLIGVEGNSSSIAWGDSDNDGDLDILLSGGTDTGRVAIVYRNNGDGSFTDANAGLTGVTASSAAWGDYDNDGKLDILILGVNASSTPISQIYKNLGNNTFVNSGAILTGLGNGSGIWGDYDNDGDLDIILTGFDGSSRATKIYRNECLIPNSVPDTPTNLRTSVLNEYTMFEWDAPDDDHTPSSGLSYNIRIGSTPEGCQIMSPMSNPDGTRQIPQIGVANDCSWKLKTSVLDSYGDYYWAVQAMDGAYLGSEFATAPSQYNIMASVLEGDVPLTTTFSIIPNQFQADNISWDFENDGITDSNDLSPTHIYTEPGTYSVKLIVQNGTEIDTTLVEDMITVTMPSTPRIVATPDTLRYGNVATNSTVSKPMNIYNWGGDDLEIYSISAANARYSITLPAGLSYPIVVPSLSSIEITVNFSPLAVQAYNTNLVIVSNDPDNGVLTKRLEGRGYILNVNFSATPLSGDVPLLVQFNDMSQGEIVARLWDFGDGNTSIEVNPTHTYEQKGMYDVTLTIQDQYTNRSITRPDYINAIAHPVIATPDSSGIDFGVVYLGDNGTHQLILQSAGTDTVFVTSVGLYQPSSAFSVAPVSIPDYILPGMQAVLDISFHPYQALAYNDTLYVYNSSENKPILKIKLRGIGEYVPPQTPQGVTIVIDGYDSVISWEAVTQNIYNTPITVPYYFIYGSLIPNPGPTEQIFIGYSTGTTFHHAGVNLPGSNVQPPPQYFYTVTAVVWYPPRSINLALIDLIGYTKAEVERYFSPIEYFK